MNFTSNNPFWMYAMESEGRDDLITTRTARINAVIRDAKDYPAPTMDEYSFDNLLRWHGFHGIEDLSKEELNHILREVRNEN